MQHGNDGKHRKQKLRQTSFFRALLECLLVSEEDETGKYILMFCFPIVSTVTGRPPREAGGGEKRRTDRQAASTGAARRILC